MALASAEDALGDWLEARGLEDAWELAQPLTARGWTVDDLDRLADGRSDGDVGRPVRRLALTEEADALVDEIRSFAERVSELVQVARRYSYVDQGEVPRVDVNAGIEDTLTILSHRIAPNITVNQDIHGELPEIEGAGGELNQAWTVILENALDAIPADGTIDIRTSSTVALTMRVK